MVQEQTQSRPNGHAIYPQMEEEIEKEQNCSRGSGDGHDEAGGGGSSGGENSGGCGSSNSRNAGSFVPAEEEEIQSVEAVVTQDINQRPTAIVEQSSTRSRISLAIDDTKQFVIDDDEESSWDLSEEEEEASIEEEDQQLLLDDAEGVIGAQVQPSWDTTTKCICFNDIGQIIDEPTEEQARPSMPSVTPSVTPSMPESHAWSVASPATRDSHTNVTLPARQGSGSGKIRNLKPSFISKASTNSSNRLSDGGSSHSFFDIDQKNEFHQYHSINNRRASFEKKIQASFKLRSYYSTPTTSASSTSTSLVGNLTSKKKRSGNSSKKRGNGSTIGGLQIREPTTEFLASSVLSQRSSLDLHGSLKSGSAYSQRPSLANSTIRSLDVQTSTDNDIVALIAKQLRSNFLFLSLDDTAIIESAKQFQVVTYAPGDVIIGQGSIGESIDGTNSESHKYYYILVEGECVLVKDGKQVHGKYGTIAKGTSFGETTVLFNNHVRTATIIASKPSPMTGTIVVYRLADTIFHEMMGSEDIYALQSHIQDIQFVIDVLSGVDTKLNKGTIIRPYKPSGFWVCRQWSGTVLQYVWPHTLAMMVLTAMFGLAISYFVGDLSPYAEHQLLDQLELIAGWWTKLSPLTTFVSTFFLAEAFKFWKRFYWTTRGIQGKLNDISMVLASNVSRDKRGKPTEEAVAALDDVARIQTLLHKLFWCTVVQRFKCLLSPEGISYLLSKKLITPNEYTSLIEVGENSLGAYHASLTWLIARVELAVKRGETDASQAGMTVFYDKVTHLRTLMARIPDMYDGRMPLAYIHFVHLLVHVLILVSPVALFPLYWFWSVIAVGILSTFYFGIYKLSLMFLDPVDNDKQHQTSGNQTVGFDIGVLIRESHTSSMRYKGCVIAMPQY